MNTKQQHPLWRVDWVHRNGYYAPYHFVEAKNKKIKRTEDLPNGWSYGRKIKTAGIAQRLVL